MLCEICTFTHLYLMIFVMVGPREGGSESLCHWGKLKRMVMQIMATVYTESFCGVVTVMPHDPSQ
jgi:hypothetical protein